MPPTDVEAFFQRLQHDSALARDYRDTVAEALRSSVGPAILDVAARHGDDFTREELDSYLASRESELDDAQLEAVTGGMSQMWAAMIEGGWLLAPIVSTAIAIPLAISDDDDDAS